MRLILAALVLTAAIAIVAAVFAIWPVVADAPWEEAVPTQTRDEHVDEINERLGRRCETLTQQLADAQTDVAARVIIGQMNEERC